MTVSVGDIEAKLTLNAQEFQRNVQVAARDTQLIIQAMQEVKTAVSSSEASYKHLADTLQKIATDDRAERAMQRQAQSAKQDAKSIAQAQKDAADSVEAGIKRVTASVMAYASAAAIVTQVIEKYKNFDQAMADTKVAAGATDAQMQQMKQTAMQLGEDMSTSSADILSGMSDVIKAGGQLSDVLDGGAKAMVSLSKAGDISIQDAGETLATVKNVYGETVGGYAQIANTMVGVGNAAAGSLGNIREAMQQSASVAHGAGMSFNDLVEALGLLHNAGLKGSDAGR